MARLAFESSLPGVMTSLFNTGCCVGRGMDGGSLGVPVSGEIGGDTFGGERLANKSTSLGTLGDLSSPASLPTVWQPAPHFTELERELGAQLCAP